MHCAKLETGSEKHYHRKSETLTIFSIYDHNLKFTLTKLYKFPLIQSPIYAIHWTRERGLQSNSSWIKRSGNGRGTLHRNANKYHHIKAVFISHIMQREYRVVIIYAYFMGLFYGAPKWQFWKLNFSIEVPFIYLEIFCYIFISACLFVILHEHETVRFHSLRWSVHFSWEQLFSIRCT